MGAAGEVGGEHGDVDDDDDDNNDGDDEEETSAARSFISFPLEKETEEPCHPPLLSLGDDMMDPDQEEGVGGEVREWGVRRERLGRSAGKDKTNAAQSIVSFSSEKETKEPWPPPLLCI